MKNYLNISNIVLSLLLLTSFSYNGIAQNLMLSFTGKGASTLVDSVKIENLSQCTNLTIGGSEILNLNNGTGIDENTIKNANYINIFPNPSSNDFTVVISVNKATEAWIQIIDLKGEILYNSFQALKSGLNGFCINELSEGIYFIKVKTSNFQFSEKFISTGKNIKSPVLNMNANIEKSVIIETSTKISNFGEKVQSLVSMKFNPGDTLKLTGKSGIYKTIKVIIPKKDMTVNFDFVDCTDADGNHYAVVQIGEQLWMAENLKTTKYRDGSAIPNVPDSATWGSTSTGAYCNFHNDTSEGAYYGRLYNFYAVSDSRNLAPSGWHVASNSEWNILEKFLDPTVDTNAWMGRGTKIGRILKEGCSTRWAVLDTTTGWNSVGFTALCSNFRNNTGAWSLAPDNNHDNAFWTSTSYTGNTAWGLSLRWCFGDIYAIPLINKRAGESVRCIKD